MKRSEVERLDTAINTIEVYASSLSSQRVPGWESAIVVRVVCRWSLSNGREESKRHCCPANALMESRPTEMMSALLTRFSRQSSRNIEWPGFRRSA